MPMLERKLENNISEFEQREIRTKLEIKKQSLEQWINYKTQGSIIRSRTRWYNERETKTKYIFELEKRHFNSKAIRNLKIDNNTALNTDEEILNEAKRHCTRQTIASVKTFLVKTSFLTITISDDARNHCEGLLTARECLESLKNMESNKDTWNGRNSS